MTVINVSQYVEQKSMNFSNFFYKSSWKFIAWKLENNINSCTCILTNVITVVEFFSVLGEIW